MVSAVLSVSSLLITFQHSLLEIGFFSCGTPRQNVRGGEEKEWGKRRVEVGAQSNITEGAGDPYMTSD